MTRSTDPALDAALSEDAAKISALGGDPGPTLEDLDAPIWDEDYLPPPWSAVIDEETGLWQVVCDGYADEMPIVCAGTPTWPLAEGDARIISASLDLLELAREFVEFAESGNHYAYPLGSLQKLREAVAKADERDARGI